MSGPPLELPAALNAALVLVRHGESTWVAEGRFQGRRDPPLSELGKRQAELVAGRLNRPRDGVPLPVPETTPRAVWHSPLRRAADTAHAIASAQTGTVRLAAHADLTELGQGEWEGLLHDEVQGRWPRELRRWRADPTSAHAPGGEPLGEAALRIRRALVAIVAELESVAVPPVARRASPVTGYPLAPEAQPGPPDPWAILVAHDGVLRLAVMTLLGVPLERFWSFPFNLCALTVISLSEGRTTLRCHNVGDHLAPLGDRDRAMEEARGDRRGAL